MKGHIASMINRRTILLTGIAAAGFLATAVAFVAVSAVANVISNVVVLWYLFAYAAVAAAIAHQPIPLTRKLEA